MTTTTAIVEEKKNTFLILNDENQINTCIELLGVFGNDAMSVNAARVSFHKWIDPKLSLQEQDKKIINFLARNNHISPFFHPHLQFRIRMPIFLARQYW